jgi:hypothetical protein
MNIRSGSRLMAPALLLAGLAVACTPTDPEVNLSVSGTLAEGDQVWPSDNSFYDDHSFRTQRGWVIELRLQTDDFRPFLWLLDSQGSDLDQWHADPGTEIVYRTVAAYTGAYTARVNTYDGGETGAYTLHVRTLPPGTPTDLPEGAELLPSGPPGSEGETPGTTDPAQASPPAEAPAEVEAAPAEAPGDAAAPAEATTAE